jgi:Zn-dependent oligopeptidase
MDLPISFDYTSKEIINIKDKIIDVNEKWIISMKNNKNIDPQKFLDSYLYKLSEFDYIYDIINFLKYVSTDKNIRDASSMFILNLEEYFIDFFKSIDNYNLFLILKKIKKNDVNNTQKLIKNILKNFENSGVKLKKSDKLKYIKIEKELLNCENIFSQNIADDIKIIKYTKKELENIDNSILQKHKKNNYYIFDTSYPDENIILKYCSNSNSRKKMHDIFNNIAKENLPILKNIINLRTKRSIIFDFKNSVSFYFSANRLATEKKINILLDKLIPILKKKSSIEYNNLLNLSNKKILNDYDLAYYSNLYQKKYLNIDENEIKEYFPSNYSIPKILEIYSNLFGIKIKLIKGKPSQYWHKDVELYGVNDSKTNLILGYFYLDLYPRPGKFTHAATFNLQNTYTDIYGKRIIPVTAIVCNFSRSLFIFNEIVTFCHEFGHAMHNILSNVKYENLSGISMESDFGEMPSQFFENWCYNEDFLKNISMNHITKKSLPDNIIKNIQKKRNYNIGLHYLTQILYIKYDLEIHHKNNVTEKYLHDTWFRICDELLPFKCSKNTLPMCRFDHLIGYASGYYGYLWSIMYAYDAFTLFEIDGIFNQDLGTRFRKEILEKGGTVNGIKMLENFLKRKTSNKTFLKKIDN